MKALLMSVAILLGLSAQTVAGSTEQEAVLRDPNTGEVLLKFTVGISAGAKPSVILSPSGQDFVARFVAAIKTKDVAKLKRMEHAQSLACHDENTKGYFDYLYAQNVNVTFADDNELTIEEIGKDDELPFSGSYTYAVRPSHLLILTYGKETVQSGGTLSRKAIYEIVGDGDDWAYVPPCADDKGLAQLRRYGLIK